MTSPEYYQKNKEKILKQTKEYYEKYKDKRIEYQRKYRKENRALVNERVKAKRNRRLDQAIILLGGKCADCTTVFDKCVYDFHHLDPSEKEFTISDNLSCAEDKFITEVMKCVLLCANCHRLRHKELRE